jgi:hypothetical protein
MQLLHRSLCLVYIATTVCVTESFIGAACAPAAATAMHGRQCNLQVGTTAVAPTCRKHPAQCIYVSLACVSIAPGREAVLVPACIQV